MTYRRINITLSESVEKKAKDLIAVGFADGMSELVARMIREEYERRHGLTPIITASSAVAEAVDGLDALPGNIQKSAAKKP